MRTRGLAVMAVLAVLIAIVSSVTFRHSIAPCLPTEVRNLLSIDEKAAAPPAEGSGGSVAPASKPQDKSDNRLIAVKAAMAKSMVMPLIERTFGSMQSPAVANVGARIVSQIVEIPVKDGQTVKAGDLLIKLDDSALRAVLTKDQALLQRDKASAADAEVELWRAKELLAKQAGTQQAYDAALAVQKASDGLVAADQAQVDADTVQLKFALITAPISGRLGEIGVAAGDLVGNGTTSAQQQSGLLTITQMQPLKVKFRLPERVLPDIQNALGAGHNVEVRIYQTGSNESLSTGSITFIDSAIDVSSGTIAMSATVDNAALKLWPGEFVNIEIHHSTLPDAISIPAVAIQLGQKGTFVWLVKTDATVEAQPVTVSRYEGVDAAISKGLAVGDNVVVEGQLQLKDGVRVSISKYGS